MQRTVYSTKFTYVENEIDEKGEIASVLREITVHETDEKKALKSAVKTIGMFKPIKTEQISELYVLDDEIFFKYATVATPKTTPTESES
jgi:hypothetical protein